MGRGSGRGCGLGGLTGRGGESAGIKRCSNQRCGGKTQGHCRGRGKERRRAREGGRGGRKSQGRGCSRGEGKHLSRCGSRGRRFRDRKEKRDRRSGVIGRRWRRRGEKGLGGARSSRSRDGRSLSSSRAPGLVSRKGCSTEREQKRVRRAGGGRRIHSERKNERKELAGKAWQSPVKAIDQGGFHGE